MQPFIGEIRMVGFNFAPRGWAFCNGNLLAIAQNSALFSLLGTTFGGDGRTSFGLPELRGRSATHPGQGPGLQDYRWGQRGGTEFVTLTQTEMPQHNHIAQLKGTDDDANTDEPNNAVPALAQVSVGGSSGQAMVYSTGAATVNMGASSILVGQAGGSQSHENRPPFLGIYHCIALVGIFPSRN